MILITRKNLYGLFALLSVVAILIYALAKTNYIWTDKTIDYLFFNAFWAVVVVLLDKYFNEKLQIEFNEIKSKFDKIRGVLVTDKDVIKTESIRLIINGVDDEISAIKAKRSLENKISEKDSVKKPGETKLTID